MKQKSHSSVTRKIRNTEKSPKQNTTLSQSRGLISKFLITLSVTVTKEHLNELFQKHLK